MQPMIFPPTSPKDESLWVEFESFKDILSFSKKFVHDQKAGDISESFSNPDEKDTSYSMPASNGKSREPVFHVPPIINFRSPYKFQVLQRWEGHIIEISKDECRALVQNLSTPGVPDEEITFSTDEISESDLPLVLPGAVFYWAIGYEDSPQGQRTRKSVIRIQRLPIWTQKEVDKAKREAKLLKDQLGW